jgi:hypothetical protein
MHGFAQVVTDEERSLLLRIARCPLILSARQGGQPCSEIVACQQVAEPARQVPEAWAGNLRKARVLFLSSNPSISEPGPGQPDDAVEPFPTAGSTDAEIVEFIGRRFDQTVRPAPWVRDDRPLLRNGRYWPTPTRFWVSIRARARELLGDGADPARNYVMTEVVHCKSRGEAGVAAAAGTCARQYLDDIVRLSAAPVIVVVGKKAHAALTALLPELPSPPYVISAELGGRARSLVYITHPSSWGGPKTIEKQYGLDALVQLRAIARGSAAGVPAPAVARSAEIHPAVTRPAGQIRPRTTSQRPVGLGTPPAPVKATGARRPIQPVQGPFLAISETHGECFVATRDTVSGQPHPAITLFVGDTAGRSVGDTFDSYHKVNGKPCGVWTVIATAQGGRLTGGHLPAGTRKFRVNRLG